MSKTNYEFIAPWLCPDNDDELLKKLRGDWLNWYDNEESLIKELDTDSKIEDFLANIKHASVASKAITRLGSDDRKIELMECFSPYDTDSRGTIIASIKSLDKRMQLLQELYNECVKSLKQSPLKESGPEGEIRDRVLINDSGLTRVILTLPEETRKEWLDKVDISQQAEIIMSLSNQDERLKLAKPLVINSYMWNILRNAGWSDEEKLEFVEKVRSNTGKYEILKDVTPGNPRGDAAKIGMLENYEVIKEIARNTIAVPVDEGIDYVKFYLIRSLPAESQVQHVNQIKNRNNRLGIIDNLPEHDERFDDARLEWIEGDKSSIQACMLIESMSPKWLKANIGNIKTLLQGADPKEIEFWTNAALRRAYEFEHTQQASKENTPVTSQAITTEEPDFNGMSVEELEALDREMDQRIASKEEEQRKKAGLIARIKEKMARVKALEGKDSKTRKGGQEQGDNH